MAAYSKAEAREWLRSELVGVCNVIIPSYSADLRTLNEAGIRHDVRREIELGFRGALLVAETAITPDEYIRFVEIAADEAAGRLALFFHASFNTLEENIQLAGRARAAGADVTLLSYPPTFYPHSLRDVYDYTAAFCDGTDMAVMLFPVPLWGFERLHPASIPIDVLTEMVDRLPNVAAIKAEGGMPAIAGFTEVWNNLGRPGGGHDASGAAGDPAGDDLAAAADRHLQHRVPRRVRAADAGALPEGKYAEAMEIYWRVDPGRRANERIGVAGSNTVHRMAWKYQAWLTGFNGGPLRMPTQRLVGPQLAGYRAAARDAGVLATDDTDELFFVGRNPS